ncbi:hypothetical protein HG530_013285 [Fusarium avenaceum]|nr:hypothetical protein HG530_013285 [Fusarium avenaceum]
MRGANLILGNDICTSGSGNLNGIGDNERRLSLYVKDSLHTSGADVVNISGEYRFVSSGKLDDCPSNGVVNGLGLQDVDGVSAANSSDSLVGARDVVGRGCINNNLGLAIVALGHGDDLGRGRLGLISRPTANS